MALDIGANVVEVVRPAAVAFLLRLDQAVDGVSCLGVKLLLAFGLFLFRGMRLHQLLYGGDFEEFPVAQKLGT